MVRSVHRLPGTLLMLIGIGLIAVAAVILIDPGAREALPLPTLSLPPTPTPGMLAGWEMPPPPRPDPGIGVRYLLPDVELEPLAAGTLELWASSRMHTASRRATTLTPAATRVFILSGTPTLTPVPTSAPTLTSAPTSTPTLTPTYTVPPPVVPERLIIPAIELDAPVVPVGWRAVTVDGQVYAQWEVPDNAVGWHEGSAKLGEPGNTVLNGHHNIRGAVFRRLVELVPGDRITLIGGGMEFTYLVVRTMTLAEASRPIEERLRNARWIGPSDDERVTLVSCWPETGNSHRVIVVAWPIGRRIWNGE